MSAFWSSEVKHCPMIPEFTSEFCSCFTLVLVSLFLLCGICVWKTRCYLTITTRTLWIFLSLKKKHSSPPPFNICCLKKMQLVGMCQKHCSLYSFLSCTPLTTDVVMHWTHCDSQDFLFETKCNDPLFVRTAKYH